MLAVASRAQDYRREADAFLRQMPSGLQEKQRVALLRAMQAETADLQSVRNARNVPPCPDARIQALDLSPVLRLYRPAKIKGKKLPLLVYFHGGGWTIGSINSCARYCEALTATGRIMVLAVNYRLAPEHPFPAGLEDCIEAFEYACSKAPEWGADPGRISVGGDSSGGNLALATALSRIQEGRRVPHSLVLFYPVVSAWNDGSASWRKYAEDAALDGALMEAFNAAYCYGINESIAADARGNSLISPSLSNDEDLRNLPPVLLVSAERDILHDQGKAFAERLKNLGVKVDRQVLKGTVHLFITVPGQEKAFRRAVRESVDFL